MALVIKYTKTSLFGVIINGKYYMAVWCGKVGSSSPQNNNRRTIFCIIPIKWVKATSSVVFRDSETVSSFDGVRGGKHMHVMYLHILPLFRCTLEIFVSIKGTHYLLCIAHFSSELTVKTYFSHLLAPF